MRSTSSHFHTLPYIHHSPSLLLNTTDNQENITKEQHQPERLELGRWGRQRALASVAQSSTLSDLVEQCGGTTLALDLLAYHTFRFPQPGGL
jgi:hypothetical protein